MTDEQIKILLKLGSDEARQLLDNREYNLYRYIQGRLLKLVREYEVRLPLNCLQFLYYVNGHVRKSGSKLSTQFPSADRRIPRGMVAAPE